MLPSTVYVCVCVEGDVWSVTGGWGVLKPGGCRVRGWEGSPWMYLHRETL